MSRKSVRFTVPGGSARGGGGSARRGPETIDAQTDEWVSDRNDGSGQSEPPRPEALLDLAAERSLAEIFALSMLTPLALTWFWLMHAMSGRARYY